MSLASYSDLQAALQTWLARQGDTNVSTNAADLITLCEARLAYGSSARSPFPSSALRIRAMEDGQSIPIQAVIGVSTVGGTANAITLTPTSAIAAYAMGQTWNFTALASNTGATTAAISGLSARAVKKGSALSALTANDIVIGQTVQLYDDGSELVYMPGTASCPLPTNYLAMRSLYLDTNPRIALEYVTPQQASLNFNTQWPDQPKKYTIEGDAIRLEPAPDTAYNLFALYYQKFGALSSATNWLMTNAPNVYLYGSLLEASILFQMFDKAQMYHGLFLGACDGLQDQDTTDRHSGAPLAIHTDLGNP